MASPAPVTGDSVPQEAGPCLPFLRTFQNCLSSSRGSAPGVTPAGPWERRHYHIDERSVLQVRGPVTSLPAQPHPCRILSRAQLTATLSPSGHARVGLHPIATCIHFFFQIKDIPGAPGAHQAQCRIQASCSWSSTSLTQHCSVRSTIGRAA